MIAISFFCSNPLQKIQFQSGFQHRVWMSNDLRNNIYQKSLKTIRKRNFNRIIIAYLNINSIKNRFKLLVSQIVGEVGVLVTSGTTLDDSFPFGLFKIPAF